MELKLLKKDTVYMISAKGSMDLYSSMPLKNMLIQLLKKDIDRFIINLAEVDAIDSGGIGALVNIASTVQKLDAKLAVTNVQETVRECINAMKVSTYIPLTDSIAEALSLLNEGA